ncbi:hypothetical protein FPV67DRAFT_1202527 [Lyophyllum atratum]|nr:hypothetical protein FPV67DRAFT_1202527 [Lyophyllum atratum]
MHSGLAAELPLKGGTYEPAAVPASLDVKSKSGSCAALAPFGDLRPSVLLSMYSAQSSSSLFSSYCASYIYTLCEDGLFAQSISALGDSIPYFYSQHYPCASHVGYIQCAIDRRPLPSVCLSRASEYLWRPRSEPPMPFGGLTIRVLVFRRIHDCAADDFQVFSHLSTSNPSILRTFIFICLVAEQGKIAGTTMKTIAGRSITLHDDDGDSCERLSSATGARCIIPTSSSTCLRSSCRAVPRSLALGFQQHPFPDVNSLF